MNTASENRWGPPAIGGLLVVVAVALVACGGSSTSSGSTAAAPATSPTPVPTPTATTVPEAVPATLTPGMTYGCAIRDPFFSSFTGTDGQTYSVNIALGQSAGCPQAGATGLSVNVAASTFGLTRNGGGVMVIGQGAGVAYLTPQSEVQATFALEKPAGSSLVVTFTGQGIEKVILIGNGAPVELQRQ